MKSLMPESFFSKEVPNKILGPTILKYHMMHEWIRSKPEHKKHLVKDQTMTYFYQIRADNKINIYYYSKWQLSWKERLKLFFTGKLFVFAVLPPPEDLPIRILPTTSPLVLEKNEA